MWGKNAGFHLSGCAGTGADPGKLRKRRSLEALPTADCPLGRRQGNTGKKKGVPEIENRH